MLDGSKVLKNPEFAAMVQDGWTWQIVPHLVDQEFPGFAKLGIEPKPLGLFLDKWMVRYRKHGRFNERLRA